MLGRRGTPIGRLEGEARGLVRGQRAILRRLLARRFGADAAPLAARLEAVRDAAALERLADAALDAADPRAFAEALAREGA